MSDGEMSGSEGFWRSVERIADRQRRLHPELRALSGVSKQPFNCSDCGQSMFHNGTVCESCRYEIEGRCHYCGQPAEKYRTKIVCEECRDEMEARRRAPIPVEPISAKCPCRACHFGHSLSCEADKPWLSEPTK